MSHLTFPVSIKSLAETEQHLTKALGSQYFHSFGHGSFLQFLASNESLQKILGGSAIGCNEEGFDTVHERQNRIISCIRQLKFCSSEVSLIESLFNCFDFIYV